MCSKYVIRYFLANALSSIDNAPRGKSAMHAKAGNNYVAAAGAALAKAAAAGEEAQQKRQQK
jgi:hypothetical protein